MFAIARKQEQYLHYILSDETAHSRLEVVPERGGLITHWRIQGQDILYFNAERFADPEKSVRGGIPILFPICGNLPDDTYIYNNQEYTLKQHGFARDLPWEVTDQSTDDAVKITLVLTSNNETLSVYPFEFELTFTYILQGNTLTIQQNFTNHSNQVMPFSVGLHPYFWVQDKNQLSFDIPANQYLDQLTQETHSFDGNFDFNKDEIDVALSPISRNYASATNHQRDLKINIQYSDLYSTLVFWTVKGKDYYCLEPWSTKRNALNTGENLTQLEPGETYSAEVEMTVSYV